LYLFKYFVNKYQEKILKPGGACQQNNVTKVFKPLAFIPSVPSGKRLRIWMADLIKPWLKIKDLADQGYPYTRVMAIARCHF